MTELPLTPYTNCHKIWQPRDNFNTIFDLSYNISRPVYTKQIDLIYLNRISLTMTQYHVGIHLLLMDLPIIYNQIILSNAHTTCYYLIRLCIRLKILKKFVDSIFFTLRYSSSQKHWLSYPQPIYLVLCYVSKSIRIKCRLIGLYLLTLPAMTKTNHLFNKEIQTSSKI